MPQERQHYVPQVYLKSWEGPVRSLSDRNTVFNGVYIFDKKDISVGDGRTRKKILFEENLYTIDFSNRFIGGRNPEIARDFAKQTLDLINTKNVYACYSGLALSSEDIIMQHFDKLDEWRFVHNENGILNDVEIISEIKAQKSYVIESTFDKYVENVWTSTLNDFLSFADSLPYGHGQIEYRYPSDEMPIKMLEMFVYMHSRNPRFDMLGLLPLAMDVILRPLFEKNEDGERYTAEMERNLWLSEIYKGLKKQSSGFFHSFLTNAYNHLGFVLFKIVDEEEGCFITSDNPAFTYASSVTATNSNGMYFPLSPNYLLFIGKNTTDGTTIAETLIRTIKNKDIRYFNRMIYTSATKSIISNKKHLGYIM